MKEQKEREIGEEAKLRQVSKSVETREVVVPRDCSSAREAEREAVEGRGVELGWWNEMDSKRSREKRRAKRGIGFESVKRMRSEEPERREMCV